MMKAVVLEISDGKATVMTEAGDIIGIKDQGYETGLEIMIGDRARADAPSKKIRRYVPLITAAAALILIMTGSSYLYLQPYGTVSLDVNPSIEYTINRFDRVLSISGVNDDGTDIVSKLDTENMINEDIETAVEATIDQIEADGYITDTDDNYLVVTANTGREDHTDRLVDKLDKRVAGHKNINPIAVKVSDDDIKEAHRQGISPGKKMMVDRLGNIYDKDFDRNEWNKKSVREIHKEYDRLQRERKAPPSQNPDEGGQMPDRPDEEQGTLQPKEPDINPDGPEDRPDTPGQQPLDPGQDPDGPGQNPEDSEEKPDRPVQQPLDPGPNPNDPGQNPVEPGKTPEKPEDKPDRLEDKPDRPGEEQETLQPKEPDINPDRPEDRPDAPGQQPLDPEPNPDGPGQNPDGPGQNPGEPGNNLEKPEDKPDRPEEEQGTLQPEEPDINPDRPGQDQEGPLSAAS